MFRVIQISDTHLSPHKSHFTDNWQPVADWLRALQPDLVIHTGDVTVDGADQEADLRYCAQRFSELGIRVLCVPGNHDVGEPQHAHQPVNDERLAHWRRHLGADWWSHDHDDWRLIGLNAMLFGSASIHERQQQDWLVGQMEAATGRRIAWFLHRPLFIDHPDEGDRGYWSVPGAARAPLMALVRKHRVAIVASGHLHTAHQLWHDDTHYVWGPSSAFLVGPELQPDLAGSKKQLGAVVYDFAAGAPNVTIHGLDGLHAHWIDDVIDEVYPPRSAG